MMNSKTNTNIVEETMIVKVLEDQIMAAGAYTGPTQQMDLRDKMKGDEYEEVSTCLNAA